MIADNEELDALLRKLNLRHEVDITGTPTPRGIMENDAAAAIRALRARVAELEQTQTRLAAELADTSGLQLMQDRAELAESQLQQVKADAERIDFYEREFYPLSNFSAFRLLWANRWFDTSEQAYHWEKFHAHPNIQAGIRQANSAHEAFKLAEAGKQYRREDWDAVKVEIMRNILRAKTEQHEYVRRKLLETGDRELVEMSWRDDFWGWGKNRDGKNWLGKLWMDVRGELRARRNDGTA